MFKYILSFLLINTHYQSLGNPISINSSISNSLVELSKQCENAFLVNAINGKVKECEIPIISGILNNNKQIRCLIFYDINKQLCSAVSASKLKLPDDYKSTIVEKQDVTTLCTFAKEWVFTNLSEFINYKNLSEKLIKSPVTCGEICGVEEAMYEANDICKYYKWGIEMLKTQTIKSQAPTEINVNNNNPAPPAILEPESNAKGDIAVINEKQQQISSTKVEIEKTKPSQVAVPDSPPENPDEAVPVPDAVSKSTVQTSKLPSTSNSGQNIAKDDGLSNGDVQKPVIDKPGLGTNQQANKPIVDNIPKPDTQNDPLSGNDLLDAGSNDPVYSEDVDGDDEDTAVNVKSPPVKQESFIRDNVPSKNVDVSQKDFYPSSDGFSDDGDHFFPFFLTAVILIVLLYVLYHNKNKVSKVFFGLILEGRQSNRRRNSRGHAYRRLDTLEQAMSANTAAPPSKIIY